MTVYVLHLKPPYKHAKHYIGFTDRETCEQRFKRHCEGRGARLTRVAVASGSELILAAVFEGAGRDVERSLKKLKNTPKWCPICKKERQK